MRSNRSKGHFGHPSCTERRHQGRQAVAVARAGIATIQPDGFGILGSGGPGRDGQVSSRPPHSNRPLDEDGTRLLRIYGVALMTRAVDERLWIQSRQGRAGFVLTGRGHEVAQVASAAALRQGHDSAWPYYRDLGVGLALGVSPYEVFLGALARADDPHSGGRQLTAHFSSPTLRIGSISSEVAAHVPHAVGAAYAARVRGDDAVAVCWFGDGAASEGATHEAMNLAGVHRTAGGVHL